MYLKRGGDPKKVPIKNVAQEANFYPPDVEKMLAETIEAPANPALDRLRKSERITDAERRTISIYLDVMLRRTPHFRRKGDEMYPKTLSEVMTRIRDLLSEEIAKNVPHAELLIQRLQQVETLEKKYQRQPPEQVIRESRTPQPKEETTNIFYLMQWRILISGGPEYFMISDNPLVYFEGYGLADPRAEFVFPLSTTHCLHGSWDREMLRQRFMVAEQRIVREINSRIACGATRMSFYHQRVEWIPVLMSKIKDQSALNRIQWG